MKFNANYSFKKSQSPQLLVHREVKKLFMLFHSNIMWFCNRKLEKNQHRQKNKNSIDRVGSFTDYLRVKFLKNNCFAQFLWLQDGKPITEQTDRDFMFLNEKQQLHIEEVDGFSYQCCKTETKKLLVRELRLSETSMYTTLKTIKKMIWNWKSNLQF